MTSAFNGSGFSSDFLSLLLGLVLTLMTFSFFLEDNWLGRFASAVLAGTMSAYVCIIIGEYIFYPLINQTFSANMSFSAWIMVGIGVVSAIFLFYGFFTNNPQSGHLTLLGLLTVSISVMMIGTAGGTIPAFFDSLIHSFDAGLESMGGTDPMMIVRSLTVVIAAILVLCTYRHHNIHLRFRKIAAPTGTGAEHLAKILVGFSLGAAAAGCFITAANIFVHNIERILALIRNLLG